MQFITGSIGPSLPTIAWGSFITLPKLVPASAAPLAAVVRTKLELDTCLMPECGGSIPDFGFD